MDFRCDLHTFVALYLQNRTNEQDLRPQDSIPFLRRVSTDFQKSEALHFLSQIDTSAAQSPSEDDLLRPEFLITGTPPSPNSPRKISHDHAPPDDMLPRDHSFVKTTFSKREFSPRFLFSVITKKNQRFSHGVQGLSSEHQEKCCYLRVLQSHWAL